MTKAGQKRNRNKWLRALRSGKYQQAQGQLARESEGGERSHCCLGVACEVYNDAHPKNKIPVKVDEEGTVSFGPEELALPPQVQTWLGLAENSGRYSADDARTIGALKDLPLEGLEGILDQDNDGGLPFEDIAKIIEAEPEGLLAE